MTRELSFGIMLVMPQDMKKSFMMRVPRPSQGQIPNATEVPVRHELIIGQTKDYVQEIMDSPIPILSPQGVTEGLPLDNVQKSAIHHLLLTNKNEPEHVSRIQLYQYLLDQPLHSSVRRTLSKRANMFFKYAKKDNEGSNVVSYKITRGRRGYPRLDSGNLKKGLEGSIMDHKQFVQMCKDKMKEESQGKDGEAKKAIGKKYADIYSKGCIKKGFDEDKGVRQSFESFQKSFSSQDDGLSAWLVKSTMSEESYLKLIDEVITSIEADGGEFGSDEKNVSVEAPVTHDLKTDHESNKDSDPSGIEVLSQDDQSNIGMKTAEGAQEIALPFAAGAELNNMDMSKNLAEIREQLHKSEMAKYVPYEGIRVTFDPTENIPNDFKVEKSEFGQITDATDKLLIDFMKKSDAYFNTKFIVDKDKPSQDNE